MKRIAFWAGALALIACVTGCTDAEFSSFTSLGSGFRVTVYSGGQAVKTFTSTGKVLWSASGAGCEFEDAATKKHVRLSGTIVAEEQ